MRRTWLLIALALFFACRGERTQNPIRHTLIDSRDTYDPRSLDPALSTDVPTGRAVGYVFEGLTRFTPDARVQPALATRWDVSADGRTYTFHLRPGVKFHDGTVLTATDVVQSFTRALSPATRGGRAEPLQPIKGAGDFSNGKTPTVAGLVTPNDSTLVITLEQPLAIFPTLLAMPVAAVLPSKRSEASPAVGTGPWKLVEWKHDDYLLFARHPEHWDGPAAAESLRARIIAEPSTAVAEFESGSVDFLEIPPAEAKRWLGDSTRSRLVVRAPALQLVYVAINTTRGPLRDRRVRQALNYAIDGRAIIDQLMGGRGRRAAGVIPPTLAGADSTRSPYPYDVAKAKQLLAEAGFAGGLELELWAGSTPLFSRLAETIQGYLTAAGVRARIVQREPAAAREAARNGKADLFVKDWYADYPDAENFLYPLLASRNTGVGGNVSFYSNAEFDRLVSAARLEQRVEIRHRLYRSADSLAFGDAPMIPLYFPEQLFAVQPWIEGFAPPAIFNGQRLTAVRFRSTR